MSVQISLGQYLDRDSKIHALDPRTKVICALIIMVLVFFIHTGAQLALGFAFVLAIAALARVGVAHLVSSIRHVVFMLALLALFNLFLTTSGSPVFSFGPIAVTDDGIRAALLFSTRLVIGLIAGVMILLTTTPARLTDAFDALLSPASRLGLPAHELAMVFSLMLRFIPTLADEAASITDAQTARGGALNEGSPARRIRAIVSVIVALLASSIKHADDLSRALDARCYEGGSARSHWHPLAYSRRDVAAFLITAAYAALLIWLGTL